jgi:hypothetical protein
MTDPLEHRTGKSQNEQFYNVRDNDGLTRYRLRPGSAVAQNAIECNA